jgi:hypothetical protein
MISAMLVAVLLVVTTPSEVGPFGVLAFFVLIYLFSLGVCTGFMRMFSILLSKVTKGFVMARPIQPMSIKKAYYMSTVISLAPVLILAMQSFGSIGFLELGLIALFIAIGCFLISKR